MTTQELEANHGPLIGRTGTYYIGIKHEKAVITAVDHQFQYIWLKIKGHGSSINPDVDTFIQNFAWDPISPPPPPARAYQPGDRVLSKISLFDPVQGFLLPSAILILKAEISPRRWEVIMPSGASVALHDTEFDFLTPCPNYSLPNVVASATGALQKRAGSEAVKVKVYPTHICSDNLAHYDSGWSAYDYCRICDQKLNT